MNAHSSIQGCHVNKPNFGSKNIEYQFHVHVMPLLKLVKGNCIEKCIKCRECASAIKRALDTLPLNFLFFSFLTPVII